MKENHISSTTFHDRKLIIIIILNQPVSVKLRELGNVQNKEEILGTQ